MRRGAVQVAASAPCVSGAGRAAPVVAAAAARASVRAACASSRVRGLYRSSSVARVHCPAAAASAALPVRAASPSPSVSPSEAWSVVVRCASSSSSSSSSGRRPELDAYVREQVVSLGPGLAADGVSADGAGPGGADGGASPDAMFRPDMSRSEQSAALARLAGAAHEAGSSKWKDAVRLYDMALEYDRRNTLAMLNKATVLKEMGRESEAERVLADAIDREGAKSDADRNDELLAELMAFCGWIFMGQRRLLRAERALARAQKLHPSEEYEMGLRYVKQMMGDVAAVPSLRANQDWKPLFGHLRRALREANLPVEVRESGVHGVGLFATKALPRGTTVFVDRVLGATTPWADRASTCRGCGRWLPESRDDDFMFDGSATSGEGIRPVDANAGRQQRIEKQRAESERERRGAGRRAIGREDLDELISPGAMQQLRDDVRRAQGMAPRVPTPETVALARERAPCSVCESTFCEELASCPGHTVHAALCGHHHDIAHHQPPPNDGTGETGVGTSERARSAYHEFVSQSAGSPAARLAGETLLACALHGGERGRQGLHDVIRSLCYVPNASPALSEADNAAREALVRALYAILDRQAAQRQLLGRNDTVGGHDGQAAGADIKEGWDVLMPWLEQPELFVRFLSAMELNAVQVSLNTLSVVSHIGSDKVLHLDTRPVEHASAIALAPLVATLNHSCKPNVKILNNDPREPRWSLSGGIRVITTEPIVEDMELFFEYDFGRYDANDARRPTARRRRQRLFEDHYFWCQCPSCVGST